MLSSSGVGCCHSENAKAESGARIRQRARRRRINGDTSEPQQKTKFSPAKQRKASCGRVAPLWLCSGQWARTFLQMAALVISLVNRFTTRLLNQLRANALRLPRWRSPFTVITLKEREPVAQ